MKICPTCGTEYPASVAFCFHDGMPLVAAQEETADDPSSIQEESTAEIFEAPEPSSMLAPTPSLSEPIDEPINSPFGDPISASDPEDESPPANTFAEEVPAEEATTPATDTPAESEPAAESDSLDEEAFFTSDVDDETISAPSSGSPVLLGVGLLLLVAVVGGGFWAYQQTQSVDAASADVETPTPAEVAKAPAKAPLKKNAPPPVADQDASKEDADEEDADEEEKSDGSEEPSEPDVPAVDASSEPAPKEEPKPKATPKPKPTPKPKAVSNQGTPKRDTSKTNMRGVPVEKPSTSTEASPWEKAEPNEDKESLREASGDENPWGQVDQ